MAPDAMVVVYNDRGRGIGRHQSEAASGGAHAEAPGAEVAMRAHAVAGDLNDHQVAYRWVRPVTAGWQMSRSCTGAAPPTRASLTKGAKRPPL
jgi:hypothetical protein